MRRSSPIWVITPQERTLTRCRINPCHYNRVQLHIKFPILKLLYTLNLDSLKILFIYKRFYWKQGGRIFWSGCCEVSWCTWGPRVEMQHLYRTARISVILSFVSESMASWWTHRRLLKHTTVQLAHQWIRRENVPRGEALWPRHVVRFTCGQLCETAPAPFRTSTRRNVYLLRDC
jgi:hypothetical protein